MTPDDPCALLVSAVVELLPTSTGRSLLVGIDGRSGSGKTDLAGRVTASLEGEGHRCSTVHLDDLYPGWSGLPRALGPLCTDVIMPLEQGRAARFRSWDWYADRPGPVVTVPAADVVVVEGVGALLAGCSARLDLRVWLEAPPELRRARALSRDGDTFAGHWDDWAAAEDLLLAQHSPPEADLWVDTSGGLGDGTRTR